MISKTNLNARILTSSLFLATLSFTLSCNDKPKVEDPKVIAEVHNDAKYDNTAKKNDTQFLVNTAEINLEEIQLSVLAQQRSKTKMVIDLGKMMEDSHNGLMAELTDFASKKIVTIPSTPTDNAKESYKKLDSKTRKDFNNAYCSLMVHGHTNAITIFERASTESIDRDIKAWAIAILPLLRKHLDNAIDCQKEYEKIK